MAGRSRKPNPSTHSHTAHPSQDWRGASGACTQTHTPQHRSQDWRGEAQTQIDTTHASHNWRVKAKNCTRTQAPQTPARNHWVWTERAHKQTHPNTPARIDGLRAKPKPKHTHHETQQGVARRSQNPYPNTHTLDIRQDWWGYRENETQRQHIWGGGRRAPVASRRRLVKNVPGAPGRCIQRRQRARCGCLRLHPDGPFGRQGRQHTALAPQLEGAQAGGAHWNWQRYLSSSLPASRTPAACPQSPLVSEPAAKKAKVGR